MLRCEAISKSFRTKVLDQVDLDLKRGEVHALLGANGAGKSTLCNLITGRLQADSGSMLLAGEPYRPSSLRDAESVGIRYVPQHPNFVEAISVAENLFLGDIPSRSGVIDFQALNTKASEVLASIELGHIDPRVPLADFGAGTRQLLSIGRALQGACSVLILDEPTAPLTAHESLALFRRIERLIDEEVAVLYVTHRMNEVRAICESFTVLRDGVCVGSDLVRNVVDNDIVTLLAGERVQSIEVVEPSEIRNTCLKVENFTGTGFTNVSFELSKGERLGIAGLVGSGRTEMLRGIYGADPVESGALTIDGQVYSSFESPKEAVDAGLMMVTEDRRSDGIVLSQSIEFNVNLVEMPNKRGSIDFQMANQSARAVMRRLDIQATGTDQETRDLSGGNQQKVAIGKWLKADAKVYLFDEPTQGIDVKARQKVHELFFELSNEQRSLLIVSSDVDELIAVCDRIITVAGGKTTGTFVRGDWSKEAILAAMFQTDETDLNVA